MAEASTKASTKSNGYSKHWEKDGDEARDERKSTYTNLVNELVTHDFYSRYFDAKMSLPAITMPQQTSISNHGVNHSTLPDSLAERRPRQLQRPDTSILLL